MENSRRSCSQVFSNTAGVGILTMKTLIVVNGEQYWQDYFPEYQVHYRRLQNSKWLYKENRLWVLDKSSIIPVDAVLWRVCVIRSQLYLLTYLELYTISQVLC